MKLSIVVPAYNEERRLGPMLERYLAYFQARYGADFELIVVVNGSTDRTEAVARACTAGAPQAAVLVEPRRVGKGAAIMQGFAAARGELVGFVDADGATPPEAFQDLADNLRDADVIIASRWMKGAAVNPRQPLDRRAASRIFNALVRLMFGIKITDTQCGAKLLSRRAVQAVLPELGLTRWAFDVDLLFQARRKGFKITEWPTTWNDMAGSRLNVPRASLEMALAIARLRLLYSPLRWVVKLYDVTLGRIFHKSP